MKYRFFLSLNGSGDTEAERVYRWHIGERSGKRMEAGIPTDRWKTGLGDYVWAARRLFESVSKSGVMMPIPIDPNGELLDGSHRVACALALKIGDVPVSHRQDFAWAPAWDQKWFVTHNMPGADFDRLMLDWAELTA